MASEPHGDPCDACGCYPDYHVALLVEASERDARVATLEALLADCGSYIRRSAGSRTSFELLSRLAATQEGATDGE